MAFSFFFQGHVILRDRDNFCAIFFALSLHFFLFKSVCISSRVTWGVRTAPVKTSLHAIFLIFRAETSAFANEVTVLSLGVSVLFVCFFFHL